MIRPRFPTRWHFAIYMAAVILFLFSFIVGDLRTEIFAGIALVLIEIWRRNDVIG